MIAPCPNSGDQHADDPKADALQKEHVQGVLQCEYERHYESYRKGCHGCIVAVWAVRDVARKIGVTIKERV